MDGGRFRHGVASGDPLTDRVVIWTRVTSEAEDVDVDWVVATDRELAKIVARGEAVARAEDDRTVQVDVGGLEPGRDYFYGFTAAAEASPTGRTRTLAAEPERVRFASCSCAKFNAGYFNAYARIAERDDLDFVLHLGDYIYEASNKPPKTQTPGADIGRPFDPEGECRTLAEYRRRYAQYRSDPDVQRLHATLPVIATIDDHELADGAWAGGADAHDPAKHGPWKARRDAAFRARWEWLPARRPDPADPTRFFRTVGLGDLAQIHLLDIRSRRDRPALEPEMSERDRSMLGAEQREWLFSALASPAPGWRLIASPSILTRTWCERPPEPLATALLKLKLIDEDGEGPDEDQWDGYPAERAALLERISGLEDVVVLSADIHISVAAEVRAESEPPCAIEVTSPSLTSQNLDEKLGVAARAEEIVASERAFERAFDHVHWCDLSAHGYVLVDLDPERLRAEWWHVDGVLERRPGERRAAAFEVPRGTAQLRSGRELHPGTSAQDAAASRSAVR
jgi:alkaline phosphatase D